MEFLRRSWRQIRDQADQLSTNARLLIFSCLIILVLALMLVLVYAGRSKYVPITMFAPDRPAEALTHLRNAGLDVKGENGQVLVRQGQEYDALAVLQRGDLMVPDTSVAFEKLFENTGIWVSNRQFTQKVHWAKQKVLGIIIAKTHGVRSADVLLDIPENVRFRETHKRPTAAVNVVMEGGQRLNRHLAEAIAGLVSGSVAEMQVRDVNIIDANIGLQVSVGEEAFGAAESLELLQQRNRYHRDMIVDMLAYIAGVIVTVNVQIDSVGSETVRETTYDKNQPLLREETLSRNLRNQQDTGEPGTRANTGANIPGSTGPGTTESEESQSTEFIDPLVTKATVKQMVGQTTDQINVSVSVPRTYVMMLLTEFAAKKSKGDGGDGAAKVEWNEEFVQTEIAKIENKVLPIINTKGNKGLVSVDWYYDGPMKIAEAGSLVGAKGLFGSPWIQPAGLFLLALTAVGIMLTMARKAMKQPPLPTAEELAGIPPTLPGDEDLVGEVDESEPPMSGVEVGEENIRTRTITGQISEMVKSNPQEAAQLFSKWVAPEE